MSTLVLTGLLAALFCLLLTPLVLRLGSALGILERTGPRHVHREPVPTAGGVALFFAFWLAVLAVHGVHPEWRGLLVGSGILLAVGFYDDCFGLRPWQKLLGQMAAALVLVGFGARIEFVSHPLGGMIYVGWWGLPLTVLWLVALTNALNFVDGLDGLAAGITAIACLPLLAIVSQRGPEVAPLIVSLLGVSAGFLVYNFNPARIFMGDSGAMFLGFVLAAVAVEGALKGATAISLSIPLLVLGLPVFDTACAVIRRSRTGRPLHEADAGHVHHRLLAAGLSQRRAVLLLYGVSSCLGVVALVLAQVAEPVAAALFLAATAAMVLWGMRLHIFDPAPDTAPGGSPAPGPVPAKGTGRRAPQPGPALHPAGTSGREGSLVEGTMAERLEG